MSAISSLKVLAY